MAVEQVAVEESIPLPKPEPLPSVIYVKQPKRKTPAVEQLKISQIEQETAPTLGWAWFEDEANDHASVERLDEVEDALASITGGDWREDDLLQSPDDVPEEIWNRSGSWWGDTETDESTQRGSLDR